MFERSRFQRNPAHGFGQPEALREHPELRAVSRLTLKESFWCLRLILWDEDQQRLVAFRDATLPSVGNRHCHHSKYDEK
jgi:fatty acid desaturase